MTLLFGQFPQAAYVVGQFALHSLVGSVGDVVVPPETPSTGSGGGGGGYYHKTYVRRDTVTPKAPENDDDLIAALTIFSLLEN